MSALKLAVWPEGPARALATALGDSVEAVEVQPFEARAALDDERVDLALIPTLDVLRNHDGLALIPAVGLVGEKSPRRKLVVGSALDDIKSIGFDPRDAQEALLAQLVLREHYGSAAAFQLANLAEPLATTLENVDAALAPVDAAVPDGAFELDPGQEWTDLTLRPMVWGLLAARAGSIDAETAHALSTIVKAAPPDESFFVDGVGAFQITLDGYALDGLELLAEHLFATGTLTEIPELPFIPPPKPLGEDDDESIEPAPDFA